MSISVHMCTACDGSESVLGMLFHRSSLLWMQYSLASLCRNNYQPLWKIIFVGFWKVHSSEINVSLHEIDILIPVWTFANYFFFLLFRARLISAKNWNRCHWHPCNSISIIRLITIQMLSLVLGGWEALCLAHSTVSAHNSQEIWGPQVLWHDFLW